VAVVENDMGSFVRDHIVVVFECTLLLLLLLQLTFLVREGGVGEDVVAADANPYAAAIGHDHVGVVLRGLLRGGLPNSGTWQSVASLKKSLK